MHFNSLSIHQGFWNSVQFFHKMCNSKWICSVVKSNFVHFRCWFQLQFSAPLSVPQKEKWGVLFRCRVASHNTQSVNYLMCVSCSYSEVFNNCFDFVLKFLQLFMRTFPAEFQAAGRRLTLDTITDKEKFCSSWILPQMRQAARYISLYKRLLLEGHVIDSRGGCISTAEQQSVDTESYVTHLWEH